jgi:ribonuclease HI
MGYNQEAFDAECAALARALEMAARRQTIPGRVTVFTDAQAAIRRMSSEEPGPGQKYAVSGQKVDRSLEKGQAGHRH